jgi:hypothetical protein
MNKVLLLFVSLCILIGCAMKPTVTENSQPVVFQFKSSYKNLNVITFFRKIEADGTKGDRFMIGQSQANALMNMPVGAFAPETVLLEPGTYYLDSFQVSVDDSTFCVSEKGHYSQRNGWDDAANQPLFLSFTVKHGESLVLPEVIFTACKPTIKDAEGVFSLGKEFAPPAPVQMPSAEASEPVTESEEEPE